jgi:asparagine synthase (glutamine-hydrolysing)
MMRVSPLLAAANAVTGTRFVGVLRPAIEAHHMLATGFTQRVAASNNWSLALETGSIAIAAGCAASLAIGSNGVVIGEVFRKDDGSRVTHFTHDETARIVAGGLAELIDRFWGPYIAVLHDPRRCETHVLRAPLGELPCLIVPVGGAFAIASDVDALGTFGLYDPLVDWCELARELARKDRVSSATCLWGMRELRGGAVELFTQSGTRTVQLWTPSRAFAQPRIDDAQQAVATVSAATRMCIASRASRLERAVVLLSGGVDSSILAAGLVEAGVEVEALTLVTRDAQGDERTYARAVCERLGIALHERQREVDEIDVMWSSAAGLPRPAGRIMWQETKRHSRDLAEDTRAGAIFGGGGGDQVFCSLHSSNPVADALKAFGPGRTAWRIAHTMSEITQVSVATILRDGVQRAWLGNCRGAPTRDTALLCREFDGPEADPPADPSGKLLPGQEAHARLILAGQSYVETLDPRSLPPVIAPLLSQPLVEACLRIPSWLWFADGLNRHVARQAFAQDLPADVLRRRSKGTPDSFTAEIFETWKPYIRELLADGELARQGIIDRTAVLEVLDDPRPPRDNRFRRVLQFAEAEAWAVGWK